MKKVLLIALIFTSMLVTSVPLTVFAQSGEGSPYSDISGKWFNSAATKYGYTDVFSDGSQKFNGDTKINRIEFVKVLHRALGININYFAANDVKDYFSDMENTDVGVNELIDLITTGILDRGGNFNPDKPLLREEMIHWVINALNYKTDGKYPMLMIMPAPFSDDGDILDAYRGEIYSSVVLKLVNGRGNNMLVPKEGATRGEAVTIVSRLMTLLDNYESTVHVNASAEFVNDGFISTSLTVRNNTDSVVILNHTSGQKYDFMLFNAAGDNVYTWSADKRFMALINETQIDPGEEIVFSEIIDIGINGAIHSAVSLKAYIVGTSDDFAIEPNGYAAAIVN